MELYCSLLVEVKDVFGHEADFILTRRGMDSLRRRIWFG